MPKRKNLFVEVWDGPEFVGFERQCPICLEAECDCQDRYRAEDGEEEW